PSRCCRATRCSRGSAGSRRWVTPRPPPTWWWTRWCGRSSRWVPATAWTASRPWRRGRGRCGAAETRRPSGAVGERLRVQGLDGLAQAGAPGAGHLVAVHLGDAGLDAVERRADDVLRAGEVPAVLGLGPRRHVGVDQRHEQGRELRALPGQLEPDAVGERPRRRL